MRYMLDTNICIYAIKKDPTKVFEELKKHEPEEICISAITYAELIYGVENSALAERNRIALAFFLANIEIMDFDSYAADEYGKICANLKKQGKMIGPMDTLIAGHAKALGCTLVTNNVREFKRVDYLELVNWAD